MPGKKDPEYFPLNLNVNLYEFEPSFSCHGKYESLEDGDNDGMSTDDEDMRTVAEVLRSRSGSNNARPRRIRNVSLNMTQNSDDEGEEGDSMQSSSDLDLDGTETETEEDEEKVDMMDTLVLSIREKLRMDPKFSPSSLWSGPAESTPPSTPYDPSTSSQCQSSLSHLRRRRIHHPYPNSKSRNPLVTVQKKGNKHQQSYWSGRRSSSGSGKSSSAHGESPYELLQELLQSGSLIKEAVRRLSNNQRRASPQPTVSSSLTISPPTSRFSLRPSIPTMTEEDISILPLSAN